MDDIHALNAPTSRDMRIDMRILKHLLQEASDLLEEAQTHALVEKHSGTTAYVLAQANWRMTATCLWAISQMTASPDEEKQGAQLHAPAPIFSRNDEQVSQNLAAFILRVDRLHERARRLDDLSRGPITSSARPDTEEQPAHAETRSSATIIPLFGAENTSHGNANPIELTRSKVRWAMGGKD